MDEPIVCIECCAEPATNPDGSLILDGWDLNGEFGERCPECRLFNQPIGGSQGASAIADVVQAVKKES